MSRLTGKGICGRSRLANKQRHDDTKCRHEYVNSNEKSDNEDTDDYNFNGDEVAITK